MINQIIIVAGMGRCGTTLLYNTIRDHNEFIVNLNSLDNMIKYNCIKTHSLAPPILTDAKVVYLFGDPLDIVLSSHDSTKVNIKKHYEHLNCNNDFTESIMPNFILHDTLNLELNFDSWYCPHNYPVLTIRYETMWDNLDMLYNFLGTKISLPPKQKRTVRNTSYWENKKLHNTYTALIEKIYNADDVKIW